MLGDSLSAAGRKLDADLAGVGKSMSEATSELGSTIAGAGGMCRRGTAALAWGGPPAAVLLACSLWRSEVLPACQQAAGPAARPRHTCYCSSPTRAACPPAPLPPRPPGHTQPPTSALGASSRWAARTGRA